ncbi:MAG: hypothetical protein J6K89_03175 [Oscillospiraceae bacterium]|nr:hypothetical protein [Oscillospiraceae bacterium]
MLLKIFAVLLGLCGIGLVLCGIVDTLFASAPSRVMHIIPLMGESASVEQTVRRALRSLKGRLYFVDQGLEPEAQMSVQLLLKGNSSAVLCNLEQMLEAVRWESSLGAGTDQREDKSDYFS